MKVYPPRDIRPFVMYCVNGKPRSSLLIESTDSMIHIYVHIYICIYIIYILSGAYEQKEERPILHYRVELYLNLNDCNTFLIWTYPQVGHIRLWSWHKCCYHKAGYSQHTTLHVPLIVYTSYDNDTYERTNNGYAPLEGSSI